MTDYKRIETIGIVGTGAMGRGIAQIAALAGLDVCLYDTNPAAVNAALDHLAETFTTLSAKGKLVDAQVRAALVHLSGTQGLAELADCDLVIEAVVERLEIKRELFGALESIVRDDCILASNT